VRGKYIRPVLWEKIFISPIFHRGARYERGVLCVSLKPMLRKTRLSRRFRREVGEERQTGIEIVKQVEEAG